MLDLNLKVNLNGRAHGTLDIDLTNVLPLLLEQRGQKVGSQLGVDQDFLFRHGNVSDSNIQAHDLLHLELDGGLLFVNLFLHVFATGEQSGELTSLGQTRSQQTGNLLDHVIGSDKEIILLGEFLDQLLVLVELLQVFHRHVVNSNTIGLFAVGGISKDAALEARAGNRGKLEGSGETLVTDGVVVLQGELSFNGFREVTLLALFGFTVHFDFLPVGVLQDGVNGLLQNFRVELGHGYVMGWFGLFRVTTGRDLVDSL